MVTRSSVLSYLAVKGMCCLFKAFHTLLLLCNAVHIGTASVLVTRYKTILLTFWSALGVCKAKYMLLCPFKGGWCTGCKGSGGANTQAAKEVVLQEIWLSKKTNSQTGVLRRKLQLVHGPQARPRRRPFCWHSTPDSMSLLWEILRACCPADGCAGPQLAWNLAYVFTLAHLTT